MNRKQWIALAITLAAAAIVLFKLQQNGPPPSDASTRPETRSGTGNNPRLTGRATGDSQAAPKKQREPDENAALVAQYGDSRTSLSKQVSQNMVSLLEDAIAMGEMATSGELGKAFGNGRGALRGSLGPVFNELKLDEQQLKQAEALHQEFQKREIEIAKSSIEKLKNNPVPLMTLMLASDATSQGKLTPEEFKQVQTETAADLSHIINPLDRKNFSGGEPLNDPAFASSFREILTDDQAAILQASTGSNEANPASPKDGNISELAPMELEKLDKAVTSGKAITSGLKQMMEGMGSLQQLGPLPGQLNSNP